MFNLLKKIFDRPSVKELKNITSENLLQKKIAVERGDYGKWLRRRIAFMEAFLIANAENGKERDLKLEEVLRLLNQEIENLNRTT